MNLSAPITANAMASTLQKNVTVSLANHLVRLGHVCRGHLMTKYDSFSYTEWALNTGEGDR